MWSVDPEIDHIICFNCNKQGSLKYFEIFLFYIFYNRLYSLFSVRNSSMYNFFYKLFK